MRRILFIWGLVTLPVFAHAQTPQWAFEGTSETLSEELADLAVESDNAARADAIAAVPESAPEIISGHGRCQGCHLPSGHGNDASAPLAGLPAAYFVRQISNFANGDRGTAYRQNMSSFAASMTVTEAIETAEYYASLPVEPWIEVHESDTVPRTFVGPREARVRYPDGGEEPLGERIVEVSKSFSSPYETGSPAFVAYVPRGSMAHGQELVTRGVGKTITCNLCHGEDLLGRNDVPPIAGRSAIYMARQLIEFRDGTRRGASAAPMLPVTANLEDADVIAIAAYVASLPPN
jgi:cytochrome c553